VQWYVAPDSALSMPFEHAFYSRRWERNEGGGQVIGEDPLTVRFHSDAGIVPPTGRLFCGSQQQWQQGASILDRLPLTNKLTGLPCCCGPAPHVGRGGLLLGGHGRPDTNFILQENRDRAQQEDGHNIIWT
jgi:hypothetical protein